MPSFLVETALLTHGLVSVSQGELREAWSGVGATFAWVDGGELRLGSMEEYLPFRLRAKELSRIDCHRLEQALLSGESGALTASGTMAVCARLGISLAVSCGIGGIGDIRGEELCPDLPALLELPTALLATSFKDMLDIPGSIRWLRQRGVAVYGENTELCSGYIFNSCAVPVTKRDNHPFPAPHSLLLQPIPAAERLQESGLLAEGISAGKEAERQGGYFHPAVNAHFDAATGGRSSRIQLASLVRNAQLAALLTKH